MKLPVCRFPFRGSPARVPHQSPTSLLPGRTSTAWIWEQVCVKCVRLCSRIYTLMLVQPRHLLRTHLCHSRIGPDPLASHHSCVTRHFIRPSAGTRALDSARALPPSGPSVDPSFPSSLLKLVPSYGTLAASEQSSPQNFSKCHSSLECLGRRGPHPPF